MLTGVGSFVVYLLSLIALSYFLVLNATYIVITIAGLFEIRAHVNRARYTPLGNRKGNPFVPGVAILVPAHNEELVIRDSVSSLLSLEYPEYEIVIINDGSTDGTLAELVDAFELNRVSEPYPLDLPCEPVRDIYQAPDHDLWVIDKETGGKADALNAGLFFTDQQLFCAVDADSVIEHGALYDVVEPFLEEPIETVATGGAVRIANGCTFDNGVITEVELPSNRLIILQTVEYLRAFLSGRVGLSRLGGLLVISGAFGLFKTEPVRDIGGYRTDSITEDMELVVRLHLELIERGEPYSITFLPRPVVWTQVPSSISGLGRQRRRWFRGLLDTLLRHRHAIGRSEYGTIGLFALPFFLFIEAAGPLIEGLGYFLIPIFIILGLLDPLIFLPFLALAIGLGAFLSAFGVFSEVYTYRRYEDSWEILVMLAYGFGEAFFYRPWKAFVSWQALFQYLRGDRQWGEMERTKFNQ